MVTNELPVHLSDALAPLGGEIFELRMKLGSGHGQMTVAHVRAGDIEQAALIGRKWCAIHAALFVGVYPFVIADSSILDEGASSAPLTSREGPESVTERAERQASEQRERPAIESVRLLGHAPANRVGA